MTGETIETMPVQATDLALPEPAWEVATLFPPQGQWSMQEYLDLTETTNRLVEFLHGSVEVLPMPTIKHQFIVFFLYRVFFDFVSQRSLGIILGAPLRVRLSPNIMREPDLVFLLAEHAERAHEPYFEGADLVVEVVSPLTTHHDLVTKYREYAQAGIPEYWIVNPQTETVTVFWLVEGVYHEHGLFGRGQVATSRLLEGLAVAVDDVFDEGERV